MIILAVAPLTAAAQTGGNGNVVVAATTPADANVEGQFIPAATEYMAEGDTLIRWIYIGMGGMTAFMLATMPITLAAVAGASATAVATSWTYDYYVVP
jgi:hypothetical protein